MFSILLINSFFICNAQSTLNYQDFHLSPSPGNPSQYTIILNTNFINIDTINYQNYTLTSTSACTYGFMNSLALYSMNPIAPSGLQASNIYITYQMPSRTYYISDQTGLYYNGEDFSYYMSCQNGPVFYIDYRTEYSDPERMISYPIHPGLSFIDSAYYEYLNHYGGCFSPTQMYSSLHITGSSSIIGKFLNVGKLTTPCATYDSVYFVRRILFSDEERNVHTSGMDSLFNFIDTSFIEKYKIKTTNIIGIAKNHFYILFDEKFIETSKYFPDSTYASTTISRFYFRDPSANIETINDFTTFKVIPNPANKEINLQIPQQFGQPKSLEIFNCIGQLQKIRTKEFANIDISSLTSGLYFIVLTNSENERIISKIIKE